jgi:hypothetical protein
VSVDDIYASEFSDASHVLPRVSIIKFKASTSPSSGRRGVIYKTGKGLRLLPSQFYHLMIEDRDEYCHDETDYIK